MGECRRREGAKAECASARGVFARGGRAYRALLGEVRLGQQQEALGRAGARGVLAGLEGLCVAAEAVEGLGRQAQVGR